MISQKGLPHGPSAYPSVELYHEEQPKLIPVTWAKAHNCLREFTDSPIKLYKDKLQIDYGQIPAWRTCDKGSQNLECIISNIKVILFLKGNTKISHSTSQTLVYNSLSLQVFPRYTKRLHMCKIKRKRLNGIERVQD